MNPDIGESLVIGADLSCLTCGTKESITFPPMTYSPSFIDEKSKLICPKCNTTYSSMAIFQESISNQPKRVTMDDIKFMFETMTKEAKYDAISIKQLCLGMFSAFTKIPIPHNCNSKNSGAGKSYLINGVSNYFPSQYVLVLIGASDKAFHHRKGILVIRDKKTNELKEVEPIIKKLKDEIFDLDVMIEVEKEKGHAKDSDKVRTNKKRIKEIELEIQSLYKQAQKLIDLDNLIIILQDTPQDSIWDTLMSLLSQDSQKNQEYIFTEKSSSGKLESRSNIMRGMPVIFTARVTDDTRNVRFEEKSRRFINVTPNVSKEKIQAANLLICARYGTTAEEYDEQIVSREDIEKAKKIVAVIVEKLISHSKFFKPKESGVKIPFAEAIANAMPSSDVWAMTVTERTMKYISIITKINMDSRPRLVNLETGAFYPISIFEDLKETLVLMERGGSNVRPYIADWYNRVFMPVFDSMNGNPSEAMDEYGMITAKEAHLGVTSQILAENTRDILNIHMPSGMEILKQYIYPLINQGLIDKAQSVLDRRNNIYFPSDQNQKKVFSLFVNSDDPRLTVADPALYPTIGVLEKSFGTIDKYCSKGGVEIKKIYRLEDFDGTEMTVQELLEKYFHKPESCFVEPK